MTLRVRQVLLVLLLSVAGGVWSLDVPYLSGRVNDQVGLIGDQSRARIVGTLEQLEKETGAQIAVLVIPTLRDDALEDFSLRVAETWKLGRKGADDGVLLLVVHQDRKIRIEVGYGLEPVLTDADCRRIIDHLMVPAFRAGDFEQGIEAAVQAMAGKIRGEEGAIPESVDDAQPEGTWMFVGIFGAMLTPFVVFAIALRGAGGWTLFLFLAPFFFIIPSILDVAFGVLGLIIWLTVIPLLRLIWPKAWQIEPGKGGGSGGSSSSGSSSWGGSSGGGFSGGGGSFGGGGASGGW